MILAMLAAACALPLGASPYGPNEAHNLHYTEPADRWDEALPLGNGMLGALVWGDGEPLIISLDRMDLWDLRPVPEFEHEDYRYDTMREWEAEGRYEDLKALYETPYHLPAPSKIPAGRLLLHWPEPPGFEEARLDIADATASASFENGARLSVWLHATEPLGFVEVAGALPRPELVAPAFAGGPEPDATPAISAGELTQLGYDPPEEFQGGSYQAYVQEGWGGFRFAVYFGWTENAGGWLGVWSVASTHEGDDPLERARTRVEAALSDDTLRDSHEAWWRDYWAKSSLSAPNPTIERQWYLETYKFGAASRRGSPPINLQGPWTADDGTLPPWKGDYHHNLNTQLSYWPAYSGNRLEEGLSYLDWLWETRGEARDWTRRFFDMPGLNVPMTADLEGKPIGGWRQYTMSATTAAWLAHHFYLHWLHSKDEAFLRERAYPYLRECAEFLEAITDERDSEGKRTLPLSSSAEIHDNRPEAWFPSITNYDLALIRWVMSASAELAEHLEKPDDASRWRQVLGELPAFSVGEDGGLLVADGHPLEESHRHFSHLMAIHPLGLIDISQGDEARRIIEAALADLERLGTDWWTGYSFSWLANLAARARDGDTAAEALEIFAKAFTLRNSFHVNGDQSGEGHSRFTYRPFTLEGNFAFAAGLQEMMLQSHTGVIEVFPAIPEDWENAAFHDLRARGAVLVSAERSGGETVQITLKSDRPGICKIRIPWRDGVSEIALSPGEPVTLTPEDG